MSDFRYRFGTYPENGKIVAAVETAASRLNTKLKSFDLRELEVSEYNKRYFGGLIENTEMRRLNLTKYGYVLAWALAYLEKPKDQVVFLDHGGGHGMLSLLAKEYGIGTVVHNDIYSVSCVDAKTIGDALGIAANHYVPGDINDLLTFFKSEQLVCDSVASYDVIEHIYDIDDFLLSLHNLSQGRMSMFLASAANEYNPRIKYSLRTMQRQFEYNDREPRPGRKPTDTVRAIVELRREIISNYAPSLNEVERDTLAGATRGLIVHDILEQVDAYLQRGVMPPAPIHPTNTCDPYTGNWFEHLMKPQDLAETLYSTGFETTICCGFYDQPHNLVKRAIKLGLNFAIRHLGVRGLYFAPYYALSAWKP